VYDVVVNEKNATVGYLILWWVSRRSGVMADRSFTSRE